MEVEGTEDISLNMEPLSPSSLNSREDQEHMDTQFQHKLAADLLSIMTTAMEDACFTPCVQKAGLKTNKHHEQCFKSCMKHFWAAWNITSDTVRRISAKIEQQKEGVE